MQTNKNNECSNPEFAVVILAGGRSSRMNYPKPWLKFNDNWNFTEAIINAYNNTGITEIVLVINSEFCSNMYSTQINRIKEQTNIAYILEPDRGRLFSLSVGLRHIKHAKYVFIQNVDAPFIQSSTILQMVKKAEPETIMIPACQLKNGHPILAETKKLLDLIKNAEESQSLKKLISTCKKKIIETQDEGVLMNINTPDEYDKVMHEFMA